MHRNDGLRILAFPSMDFAGQEYKDPKETRSFLKSKGVLFDAFRIIKVSGSNMNPIYKYLMKCTADQDITWNFSTVFVVGRDGSVRARIDKPQANEWASVKAELTTCLKEDFSCSNEDEKKEITVEDLATEV